METSLLLLSDPAAIIFTFSFKFWKTDQKFPFDFTEKKKIQYVPDLLTCLLNSEGVDLHLLRYTSTIFNVSQDSRRETTT